MIIGVLGKGGSGKSTVSTLLALAFSRAHRVLAIDADHNMDLTYNLNVQHTFPYLGTALPDIKIHAGLTEAADYRDAVRIHTKEIFSITPPDAFTQQYTTICSDTLSLMSAGPQTEEVLTDKACSHVLFTPLKVYLPLLSVKEHEWVIVDEKAGADGVSTGIPTGFDLALIVVEPTPHSIKTGKQIKSLLDHFSVPSAFIINKAKETDDIETVLGEAPLYRIPFSLEATSYDIETIMPLCVLLTQLKPQYVGKRLHRSKEKFSL